MSLNVKILWVEEDRSWLCGARTCLEEKLRQELALGLDERDAIDSAEQDKREIDAQWVEEEVAQFKGYDMAFIDYQLGGETTGAHFAKKLRDEKKYTEIIFYSANKDEAEKALLDAGLQLSGIYLIGRGQDAEPKGFVAECFPYMKAILGKILDLTRMRGIVVGEMSNIESKLAERVMAHPKFKIINGEEIVARAAADLKARACHTGKINAGKQKAPELLKDKTTRKRIFQRQIVEPIAKEIVGDTAAFKKYASATEKLRWLRNDLAHQSSLPDEYDDARFLQIRKDIEKCRKLLDEAFPPVTPE